MDVRLAPEKKLVNLLQRDAFIPALIMSYEDDGHEEEEEEEEALHTGQATLPYSKFHSLILGQNMEMCAEGWGVVLGAGAEGRCSCQGRALNSSSAVNSVNTYEAKGQT